MQLTKVFEWIRVNWILAAAILLGLLLVLGAMKSSFDGWREARAYEREARIAKQDASDALKKAADIAREKVELEKQLAELEAKRDGKQTEVETARIEALNSQLDLDRARRERRTDNPDRTQLCTELAVLGYPCD